MLDSRQLQHAMEILRSRVSSEILFVLSPYQWIIEDA